MSGNNGSMYLHELSLRASHASSHLTRQQPLEGGAVLTLFTDPETEVQRGQVDTNAPQDGDETERWKPSVCLRHPLPNNVDWLEVFLEALS